MCSTLICTLEDIIDCGTNIHLHGKAPLILMAGVSVALGKMDRADPLVQWIDNAV